MLLFIISSYFQNTQNNNINIQKNSILTSHQVIIFSHSYLSGQTRDVEVYRLISCGTIEEKVYRLQVFKGGLMRSVGTDSETTNNDSTERDQQKDALEFDASTKSSSVPRYFSRRDIAELFKEGNHSQSETAMAFVNAGICSNDSITFDILLEDSYFLLFL